MARESKFNRRCRGIQLAGVGLYLIFQMGCESRPTSTSGLYRETPCPPAEIISQLRQDLSKRSIGTSEPSPEGKGLAIYTDSILERNGKQERLGKYKLVAQPIENANKSGITMQRVEGKSKGIRERKWYDDDATVAKPESEQQVWQRIEGICTRGQQ